MLQWKCVKLFKKVGLILFIQEVLLVGKFPWSKSMLESKDDCEKHAHPPHNYKIVRQLLIFPTKSVAVAYYQGLPPPKALYLPVCLYLKLEDGSLSDMLVDPSVQFAKFRQCRRPHPKSSQARVVVHRLRMCRWQFWPQTV